MSHQQGLAHAQQVGLDLFAWVEACRAKLKTLATALAAAGTVAEAEAVVW